MDPATFLHGELARVQVFVAFIAPPGPAAGELTDWPQAFCRGPEGGWRPLPFGRSHRARQLLSLLVAYPDGINGPAASRWFDVEPADAEPAPRLAGRDERAKSALDTLRDKLGAADPELPDLLVVPPGHRRARPWHLQRATSDVALARRAVDAGQWELAWLLVHGGAGRLIGVPRDRAPSRRRAVPALELLSTQRGAMRTGVLPPPLVTEAEDTTRDVLSRYAAVTEAPPAAVPAIVSYVLRGVDEPAAGTEAATELGPVRDGEVVSDALVPERSLEGSEPESESAGYLPVQVRPLTVPAAARRRARVRALAGGGLTVGLALALIVVLLVGHPRPGTAIAAGTRLGETSSADGRLEVQTYVSAANTFRNPRALDGPIVRIPPGATVLVGCREFIPGPRSFAPYWWYKVLSTPAAGRWVPANSFLNGDPAADFLGAHPHPPRVEHSVDASVAICGGGRPDGTRLSPLTGSVGTYANPSGGQDAGAVLRRDAVAIASCKVPSAAPTAEPGGWAYRLVSAPWKGRFYAPARAFANEVPADDGHVELVDPNIPTCPG